MYTDNPYLSREDVGIERLLKEKKWARVIIVFAAIGIFAGLSAAITFYFQYKLILTTILALISGSIDRSRKPHSPKYSNSLHVSSHCQCSHIHSCSILEGRVADMDLSAQILVLARLCLASHVLNWPICSNRSRPLSSPVVHCRQLLRG